MGILADAALIRLPADLYVATARSHILVRHRCGDAWAAIYCSVHIDGEPFYQFTNLEVVEVHWDRRRVPILPKRHEFINVQVCLVDVIWTVFGNGTMGSR